jgi:hypothetical protein
MKHFKKFIDLLIRQRRIRIIVVAVTGFFTVMLERTSYITLISIVNNLLMIELFIGLILVVLQFRKGKRYRAIIQIISGIIITWATIVFLIPASMFGEDKDTFADNITIPTDIEFSKPTSQCWHNMEASSWEMMNFFSEQYNKRQEVSIKTGEDLELCEWMQWWIYWYKARIKTQKSWKIYLKAFEITKQTPLSESDIPQKSISNLTEIQVWNTSWLIKQFTLSSREWYSDNDFTIYEWDFNKKYVARFELRFKPDDWSKDYKILEKNYLIEWWMR